MKGAVDKSSAPMLVLCADGEELTSAFVLAYGKQRLEITGDLILKRALFALIAVYYITDLSYPKVRAGWPIEWQASREGYSEISDYKFEEGAKCQSLM